MRIKDLKPFAFRLSSFVDPFQPIEHSFKLSRKVMKIALNYKVPLIINTKAVGYDKDLLENLASKELAVLQVSLSVIGEKLSSLLEPNAPKPIERLDYAEKIEAPKILRLQPLIPGVSEIEEIVEQAKAAGFRHVIAEVLRDDEKNMQIYRRISKDFPELEVYNPSVEVGKVLRPKAEFRLKIYEEVKRKAEKVGLDFSVCKEPFFDLNTKNCCGMHYLDCAIRITLKELKEGNFKNFVYGDELKKYPKAIGKGLRWHEKVLMKVAQEKFKISV